ncbi:MAG: CotH kinase family protein [Oscillospiraceae bacterium]|nr:CotH kinase family protein [Oscillospiraceae bacterium]
MCRKNIICAISFITAVLMLAGCNKTEPVPQETTALTTSAVSSETVTTTSVTEETTAVTTTETTAEEILPSPVMEQYAEAAERVDELLGEICDKMEKPAVHIFTYDGEPVLSKETYNDSVIDIFNCGDEFRLTAEGGVKVRGNSSAEGKEKPYRIKFTQPQNMLGLHDGLEYKSWVLLKSNWNLISDFMALSLAEEIFQGEYYSSDCAFVNVYINGEYKGIYLLCEQNQAAEGRVTLHEPAKDETSADIGYFLEIDHYAGNDPSEPYFTLDYDNIQLTDFVGTTRNVVADSYTIKSDTVSDEQREFIAKYTEGVFKIVYEAVENGRLFMFDENYDVVSAEGVYSTPKEAAEAVMDLDSVVNMLILEELVHNYDVGEGSFFMAVDFSETSIYNRLTFLAPWDFNWGYEGSSKDRYYGGAFQDYTFDGADRSNIWLTLLMKADWFRDMVKEKWVFLQSDRSLNNVVTEVCEELVTLENDLGDEAWRIDSAADIAEFVDGRITWLDKMWNEETDG